MKFQEVLIPYQWNSDWVHDKAKEMINLFKDKHINLDNFIVESGQTFHWGGEIF